jgi:hypothetical protein
VSTTTWHGLTPDEVRALVNRKLRKGEPVMDIFATPVDIVPLPGDEIPKRWVPTQAQRSEVRGCETRVLDEMHWAVPLTGLLDQARFAYSDRQMQESTR